MVSCFLWFNVSLMQMRSIVQPGNQPQVLGGRRQGDANMKPEVDFGMCSSERGASGAKIHAKVSWLALRLPFKGMFSPILTLFCQA